MTSPQTTWAMAVRIRFAPPDPRTLTAPSECSMTVGAIMVESLAGALRHADELDEFNSPGLFFGGVHIAHRNTAGELAGGGDFRRNGTVGKTG